MELGKLETDSSPEERDALASASFKGLLADTAWMTSKPVKEAPPPSDGLLPAEKPSGKQ